MSKETRKYLSKTEKSLTINLSTIQLGRLLGLLGITIIEPIHVKDTKVKLLEHFKFNSYKGLNENYPVEISPESDEAEITTKSSQVLDTIDRELMKGHFLHIRLVDVQQRGSGNPVAILARNSQRKSGEAYRREPKDTLNNKLIFQRGKLIGFNTPAGEILIEPGMHIDIFSQPVSVSAEVTGLDNENNQDMEHVRLGGGFRLEFEGIKPHSTPRFIFRMAMALDDNSPRVTALASPEDRKVPRKEMIILLEFDQKQNKFVFPDDSDTDSAQMLEVINGGQEKVKAQDIGLMVLKNLVNEDGRAMAQWLKYVVSINPSEGVHSIEGVFSVKRNGKSLSLIGPKIISWDGLETAKEWLDLDRKIKMENIDYEELKSDNSVLSPQLHLLRLLSRSGLLNPQLNNTQLEFLLEKRREFHKYQNNIVFLINSMLIEAPLSAEIKEIIVRHIQPGYEQTFSRQRTGTRLLGDLLYTSSLQSLNDGKGNYKLPNQWELIYKGQSDASECDVYQLDVNDDNGDNNLILVSLDGFNLGFWIQGDELLEINNVLELQEKSKKLGKLLDIQIVPAMFNYLREGD